jgi:hypothetical protein
MSTVDTGKKMEVAVFGRVCDLCGKPLGEEHETDHALYMSFNFGYYSQRDGDSWEWDACAGCADEVAKHLDAIRHYRRVDGSDPDEFCGAD